MKRAKRNHAARRQAKAIARAEQYERALAMRCPTCKADPGVWCFYRRDLGPGLHGRRWNAAGEAQS